MTEYEINRLVFWVAAAICFAGIWRVSVGSSPVTSTKGD